MVVIVRAGFVLCLSVTLNVCAKTQQGRKPANSSSATTQKRKQPLAQIDLSKIGPIATKGRVQDKDYNELEVIDQLIGNGKASIPFLISKLDDRTTIDNHVMFSWPKVTVGDVALIVMSDFSLYTTW